MRWHKQRAPLRAKTSLPGEARRDRDNNRTKQWNPSQLEVKTIATPRHRAR